MSRGVEELFERIREIPRIAEGSGYREVDNIVIYEIIDGITRQFEIDDIIIKGYAHEGQRVNGNRKLLAETIENCIQNGIDAISRSIKRDGNAIILWYDEQKKVLYEANTGPEVSHAERQAMFKVGERGAKRHEQSEKIGLALTQRYLQAIGCDIECYERAEVEKIKKEHRTILGEYAERINVVFGIKCR